MNHDGIKKDTQEDLFNTIARRAGKTTILQATPNGAYMVWMTPDEVDPMTALMSAALTIMIRRGVDPDAKSGITVRKVMAGLRGPGHNYFWQVTSNEGVCIASGYANDEHEAAAKIAEYVKMHPALPVKTTDEECGASGAGHRMGPFGMHGETQCEYCGKAEE